MAVLNTLYRGIIAALALFAGCLLVLITVGIGLEAIMRSLGLGLIRGMVDIAEHAMFCIALLPAPWILTHQGHIRITLLTDRLSGVPAKGVALLGDGICLAVSLAVTWFGLAVLTDSVIRDELIFQDLVIPEWWLQWQVPATFALLSIEFALRLIRLLAGNDVPVVPTPLEDF